MKKLGLRWDFCGPSVCWPRLPRPLVRETPPSRVILGSLLLSCLHRSAQAQDVLSDRRDFLHQVVPKGSQSQHSLDPAAERRLLAGQGYPVLPNLMIRPLHVNTYAKKPERSQTT